MHHFDRLPTNLGSFVSVMPDTLHGLDTISEHGAYGLADLSGQYFPPNMATPLCMNTPQMGLQASRASQLMTRATHFNSEVADQSPCKSLFFVLLAACPRVNSGAKTVLTFL